MRRKHFHTLATFLLVATLLILIGFLLALIGRYDVTVFPLSIRVGTYVGFDVNTTALNFGTALPGSVVERGITLVAARDRHVIFYVQGIDFISVSKTGFILKGGEPVTVAVKAIVPASQPTGSYTGRLIIVAKDI